MDKTKEKIILQDGREIYRQRTECYTRVMGYHRPVSQFNAGKKSEYYSRTYFKEGKTCNSKFCENYDS